MFNFVSVPTQQSFHHLQYLRQLITAPTLSVWGRVSNCIIVKLNGCYGISNRNRLFARDFFCMISSRENIKSQMTGLCGAPNKEAVIRKAFPCHNAITHDPWRSQVSHLCKTFDHLASFKLIYSTLYQFGCYYTWFTTVCTKEQIA